MFKLSIFSSKFSSWPVYSWLFSQNLFQASYETANIIWIYQIPPRAVSRKVFRDASRVHAKCIRASCFLREICIRRGIVLPHPSLELDIYWAVHVCEDWWPHVFQRKHSHFKYVYWWISRRIRFFVLFINAQLLVWNGNIVICVPLSIFLFFF